MEEKKRRNNFNKTPLKSEFDCRNFWASLLTEISCMETCGIIHKRFRFKENFGTGYFEYFKIDGLYLSITDVIFKEDLIISGIRVYEVLELSYLLEGEQIISLDLSTEDLVYESQECYLWHLSQNSGKVCYSKNKPFKEVKVRMDNAFIKRHHLDGEYKLKQNYSIGKNQQNYITPLCTKKQTILSEILTDTRKGLIKRLFLESKVLELLAIQLDTKNQPTISKKDNSTNVVKKMYQIQNIITSDLSTQFSIQQLSRKVGLNDFAVKKEFKRVFKQTIFEYALEQRMQKAKKMLQYSQKPIYEISESIGYKNATHFSAAFKKSIGISPKKYRNALF